MSTTGSTLRERTREVLLDRLLKAELKPGQRLHETSLSEQLGVSRTPLREALRGLQQDGLVEYLPNRGFSVPELNETAVREIYPMLGHLEALALQLCSRHSKSDLQALRALNNRMARPELSTRERYRADRQWHELLVASHFNRTLSQTVRSLHQRVALYDGAWKRGLADIVNSCGEHAAIVDRLEVGDVDGAAKDLIAHWERGVSVVIDWLRSRKSTSR